MYAVVVLVAVGVEAGVEGGEGDADDADLAWISGEGSGGGVGGKLGRGPDFSMTTCT
jgi:hypothetical protein